MLCHGRVAIAAAGIALAIEVMGDAADALLPALLHHRQYVALQYCVEFCMRHWAIE